MIVLDEEHDSSYKQSPPIPPPYYHARDVAEHIGRLHGAALILGSATPDLVTAWRAERGTIRLLKLPDRVLVHRARVEQQVAALHISSDRYLPEEPASAPDALIAPLPPVTVIDMRHELRAGNRSMFSRELHAALSETLAADQQALLYLNRRGTATFVLCRDCGYVAKCPRCDSPLTYHESEAEQAAQRAGHIGPQTTAGTGEAASSAGSECSASCSVSLTLSVPLAICDEFTRYTPGTLVVTGGTDCE